MTQLERTLTFPTLLIITINSIMGTGIFFLPAVGAREAGPASILSWIAMAGIAVIIGLIFAELVGMYPKSGGVYEYTKQAMGTFPSFIFGWITLIAANITIAMLVVGAVRYLNPVLPGFANIGISILIVAIFNYMAFRGMQTSAIMLVAFGFVTLGTLIALIVPGLFTFSFGNLVPFWQFPASKVLLTVFFIAETFFGWETATFLAEETKDPEKNMPRAMWMSTVIIAIICIMFVVVSLGNVPWLRFGDESAPLAYLAGLYFGGGFVPVISIFVYLSIIGSVAGWIVSAPRLVMSLAADKLFIQQFADIHPLYRTPHKAIIFQTVLTSALIIIGSGNFEILLELLVPLVLFMYSGVITSFLILRFTRPDEPRPFRIWGGKALGIISVLCTLGLLMTWLVLAHNAVPIILLGTSFIFLGVPLFLLLTYFYNSEAIAGILNRLAVLNLWLEDIILPKRLRQEVLQLFEHLEDKHVLEFGAGVGTLTQHLAERVGPKGIVFALDVSLHNITLLERRMRKLGHAHVRPMHDPHLVNRVHPSIESVDIVVSVGNLSYIQDLRKVLRDMLAILPPRGEICFVEYIDMFWFLPNNPKWIKNPDAVNRLFSDAGFSVSMKVRKGIFWNYLYIYGVKERRDLPYI